MLTDAIINLGVGMENLQKEMKGMRHAQEETNKRLNSLEKHQEKTNLTLGEMRLSYMRLDESFNKYAQRNDDRTENHGTRLVRLEERNFGTPMTAKEPRAIYRKRKKKK